MGKNNISKYPKRIWVNGTMDSGEWFDSFEIMIDNCELEDDDTILTYELADVGRIKEDRKFTFVSDKKKPKKK